MEQPLLTIDGLRVSCGSGPHRTEILKGVNLTVRDRSVVALVGGSGGGKTMTGLSVLRLLPPAMSMDSGIIAFKGEDVVRFSPRRLRRMRGKEISMIFQEPLSALNPLLTIGAQMNEVLYYHAKLRRRQRRERIWHLLDTVGIPDVKRIARCYPHQLSGGLRQRAMIAQAIAAEPQLIIADEPTSNLDVTLQARIIALFRKLKDELKISMVLITHDLGVVNQMADEVAVLYDGIIIEHGTKDTVFEKPQHPFTQELLVAAGVA